MSRRIQLLFVDDEPDFVEYMTRRLERHDLEVAAYTSAVQALEETRDRRFDVGLLDLKMPEMMGDELLERLKERDPGMEVIILTGHGSIESAFRTGQMQAYEYLLKPCDFEALVRAINSAYARRIKEQHGDRAPQVDSLMKRALSMSPLDVLAELKRINDSVGQSMAATAFAESGEHDTAREMMEGESGPERGKSGTQAPDPDDS
ncbi:MAG: response regulator [Candidatus Krumholzibacteriia bacterium]